MIVRKMEARDVPAAAAMEKEFFSDPWSEKAFQDAISDENALYVVLEEEGKVIGYCGLWQSFEEADIMNVAIAGEHRQKGAGYFMLTELMELGRKMGITAFSLEVRESNLPAIRLYQKLGFSLEGIRRNFYQKPTENAWVMWKR